jgi:hypothetical protein
MTWAEFVDALVEYADAERKAGDRFIDVMDGGLMRMSLRADETDRLIQKCAEECAAVLVERMGVRR